MRLDRAATLFLGTALGICAAPPAQAALLTFTSPAVFNTVAPGLPVETFEAGLVSSASVTTCQGPLNSSVASVCFASGALLPGVTYSASGAVPRNVVVLGAGFLATGNASKVLGPDALGDTINLPFASANAVGFDLFHGPVPGDVVVSVFSPLDLLLGSFTVSAPLSGTFFGIVSDSGSIGRLNVASLGASTGELVDNVAFGTTTVPEPASIILLGISLGTGLAARWRRGSRPTGVARSSRAWRTESTT